MPNLPASLGLTNIADGALAVASDERNNFASIQTAVNGLINTFNTGITGQVFQGTGTTITPIYPPGYEFPGTYVEFTAPVTISATTEATANTIVTAGAFTFDGSTAVWIEFFSVGIDVAANAGGNAVAVCLYEDGASIGFMAQAASSTNTDVQTPVRVARRRTPATGSRTYSIRAFRSNANGTVNAGVGGLAANEPGYIRITKA